MAVLLDEATGGVTRRLAAILVAGYSRLVPGDEKENFAELRGLLTGVVEPQIGEFGGTIFKETTELVLAEFDDVVSCPLGLGSAVWDIHEHEPWTARAHCFWRPRASAS
jgi:class 3 adenylate cyclase